MANEKEFVVSFEHGGTKLPIASFPDVLQACSFALHVHQGANLSHRIYVFEHYLTERILILDIRS